MLGKCLEKLNMINNTSQRRRTRSFFFFFIYDSIWANSAYKVDRHDGEKDGHDGEKDGSTE